MFDAFERLLQKEWRRFPRNDLPPERDLDFVVSSIENDLDLARTGLGNPIRVFVGIEEYGDDTIVLAANPKADRFVTAYIVKQSFSKVKRELAFCGCELYDVGNEPERLLRRATNQLNINCAFKA